jgi:opacity protein-like surface antigen
MTRIFTLAVVAAALMLAAAAPAATGGKLTGTVGPGFTITMTAKSVKAGTYTITIRDRSYIHNFHLVGPGINNKTSVGAVKTRVRTTVFGVADGGRPLYELARRRGG